MRILIVTQYYPPESSTIPASVASEMALRGHEVRVLTGFPNYPSGKIFPGYKQKWRKYEKDNLVDILRVPLYADHSTNVARRILNYVSFSFSAATAVKFAKNVDVIYVYATQMTPAFGPWLWRKFGGAPYVLHVQDLWPDSITGSSMVSGSLFAKVVDATLVPWLNNVYGNAARVIGIAPTMVRTLIERGAPVERTELVYNWASESSSLGSASLSEPRSVTKILYAGNVGDMQDLETVVRAANQVKEKSVQITIVGDGVALEKIKSLASEIGATNVQFVGRVPRSEMSAFYRQADYSLVTLKNLTVFRGTIPSKLQASVANGIPVITNVQGDVKDIVHRSEIGFTADPEDPNSLASAFCAAAELNGREYADMKTRTRETYLHLFSRESGVASIEKILLAARSDDVV